MIVNKNSYNLLKNLNFLVFKNLNSLVLIGPNGCLILKLPKIYFLCFINKNKFSFIFINNYFFQSFIKLLRTFNYRLFYFYFFKLKLKGRGYRIKRFCSKLYRFYFITVNYIYLHVPSSVLIKLRKRRIFFYWS